VNKPSFGKRRHQVLKTNQDCLDAVSFAWKYPGHFLHIPAIVTGDSSAS
jgi:hypothetical protein